MANAIHQQNSKPVGRAAAALLKEPLDATAHVKKITDTKSLDELQSVFKEVYVACKDDTEALKAITTAKEQMKSLFTGE